MKKLALIGENISHSKSKKVYESILGEKVDYALLDIANKEDIPSLEELFGIFEGISITSPYKTVFCNKVFVGDKFVRQLNSINCLTKKECFLEGTSTDFFALQDHFEDLKKKYGFFRVALLGDGNMSGVTRFILQRMGMECKVFSRRLGNLDSDTILEGVFPSHEKIIVVNSCSREFVFRGEAPKNCLFWDYNYGIGGHEEYLKKKYSYKDGYSLLELQAKYALNFWYGR